MTEWGAMFHDGGVTHPWNGRTARQRAEEYIRDFHETHDRDALVLVRREDGGEWTVVHEPLLTSSRYGCHCHCSCGWRSISYTTVTGAHLAFGRHLLGDQ